jgi:hypothetical protein
VPERGTATAVIEPLGRLRAAGRKAVPAEAEAVAAFVEPGAKRHGARVTQG